MTLTMPIARVAVAMLAWIAVGAAARAELSLERVGQYLPLAPHTVAAAPIFTFFDVAGFRRSARFAAPAPAEAEQRRWQGIAGMPLPLAPHPPTAQALREATGIDSTALARVLIFGDPPNEVLVLSGGKAMADAGALDAALGRRGFARADENAWTVWHRFPDYQLSIRERDPADPFGGSLGKSARIAARGDDVVGTAAWPTLRASLAAIDGRAPSLSGVADFVAVLHGTADAARRLDGVAIRAAGFHVGQTGAVPLDPAALLQGTIDQARAALEAQARRQASGERLPPYAFAVIAEVSAGPREGAVIALSYGSEAAAQQAAALLGRRLAAPAALGGRAAQLESRVVALPVPAGAPTAWATVAVAIYAVDPAVPPLFGAWLAAIFQRAFAPIALDAQ